MSLSFTYEVDSANKLLICEATGTVSRVLEIEHMLKSIVKLAGKNQVKNVVLDDTQLIISCSKMSMTTLLLAIKEEGWLTEMKIARLINPQDNTHNLVGEMSERYNLPIKNFDSRSDAMMWLLFNI
ncbi:MAG: hypothetical protein NWQ54_17045 [Paraglaciecola sp.]|uniref:hypothetical protein n=1 Tax=Pseudomonadati TaxID=3379134 RepID=UPI00274017E0|nr:hypothetical protein [Paraglaciecola sp.]MDP5028917.1 hypothetical protein [Paraglaciecola sp.]MDP5132585.1 hypothetical protein [Paraglaciecola sp.]